MSYHLKIIKIHFELLMLGTALVLLCQQIEAQDDEKKSAEAPRWTAFKELTAERIPEADWSAFYGFTVAGNTTVVEDRFLYPISDPPLFTGDRIISVKSKRVETKEQLYEELNSYLKSPISIRVERASRGGKPKELRIEVTRVDHELMRTELGKRNRPWTPNVRVPRLTSSEPYSFGVIPPNIRAEIVGYCDDLQDDQGNRLPVLAAGPIPAKGISRAEFADRHKLFKDIGHFVLLDKRNKRRSYLPPPPYFGSILVTNLRDEVLKTGDMVGLSESSVLVEDPMKIKVDGKERKVSVLTVCEFGYDNEY